MVFSFSGVALCNAFQQVLGQAQKIQFTADLYIAAGKEANKPTIVLQLSKGTLGLDRAVDSQQFSFFCADAL